MARPNCPSNPGRQPQEGKYRAKIVPLSCSGPAYGYLYLVGCTDDGFQQEVVSLIALIALIALITTNT